MKVLITGGAGYIGSHINYLLRTKNIDTVILDNCINGHIEATNSSVIYNGNFGDALLLDTIMTSHTFDAVIHCAAFTSVPESVFLPSEYYENNVVGMKHLLDACVRHNIKYFIFSSSAATFGNPVYLPIDEMHLQRPINPYGQTKLIGEKMLADYEKAYGIKYCILRYFCAAGASPTGGIGESHNPETHLIPILVSAALNNKTFKVYGNNYDTKDGSCIRDFVHVMDLAEAHYLSLQYIIANDVSEHFNLGSGEGFSILEMIEEVKKLGYAIQYEIADPRPGDPAVLIASYNKAANILGWTPQFSDIKTILQHVIAWEQNRWY